MGLAPYLAAWLVVFAAGPTGKPRVDPREVNRHEPPTKAEIQRKQVEFKRRSAELQRKSADLKRKLPQSSSLANSAAVKKSAERATASFNAASAPSPEDCWRTFVSEARSATTFEPLLKYLPLEKADSLRGQQASFDPRQAAESKASWRKRDPKMSEETLEHLTSSPYAHELKWHKDIAAKYIAVIGVKVEGNQATLQVSTHSDAVVDGAKYPYSTAKVELTGQGNYWRLSGYGDGNIVYQDVPQAP